MKTAAHVVLASVSVMMLAASACNYAKPMMYIDVMNNSGHAMENLEVKYPSGTFGLPELRDGQTHKHMAPFGTPCKFSIAFEDQAGKKYAQDFELGGQCPTEVEFEAGSGMSLSARRVRP